MPVSAKRKKDGKPVRRAQPAIPAAEAEGTSASSGAGGQQQRDVARRLGKPTNPFVEKHGHKGSQRGR